MFQNVAEMDNSGCDEVENISSNIKYRLKKIFKYQNIIIYILTFLMSTLSVKGEFAPFGLAMVAACVGEAVPVIGVFVVALIGTLLGNGLAVLGEFFVTSLIYFVLVLNFVHFYFQAYYHHQFTIIRHRFQKSLILLQLQ